jgi:N-acetylglucosamine-6-sulfatase
VRRFLALTLSAAVWLLIIPGCAKRPSATAEHPNVIVIMTDDQTVEEMRVMRNMNRLIADRGVTFDNSFVSYPLCCPSRATFLTGQYARNHGVLSNHSPNGSYYKLNSSNTLAVWLRKTGYDTIDIGKYLNAYGRRDPNEVPTGWSDWHGAVDSGYFDYRMNDNGQVHHYGSSERAYETRVVSRKAVAAIDSHARSKRAFFMWVAFKAPHAGDPRESDDPAPPFVTPARSARYRGRYSAEQLPRSPSFNEADVSDKPPWIRRPALSTRYLEGLTAVYRQELESLRSVDDAVGEIVHALADGHLLGRTVLMFTSDNGVFHGEHRLGVSKLLAYEPAIRVPLVISGPGFPRHRHSSALAVNIDLAPTIVELTGARAGLPMDGTSLLDLFRRRSAPWRREFLVEGVPDPGVIIPPYAGLRTTRYLYVDYRNTDHDELYDLARDPGELINVYNAERYARTLDRLKAEYRSLAAQIRH